MRRTLFPILFGLACGVPVGWLMFAGARAVISPGYAAEAPPRPAAASTSDAPTEVAPRPRAVPLALAQAAADSDRAARQNGGGGRDGQAEKKPNILVIWGDDIGTWNISHNNRGMMGYMTPNIDRIAREGVSFTDYYGQQSCTAGRAAFIGGNVPVRTGTLPPMNAARPAVQLCWP
jgi:hypothetical protein